MSWSCLITSITWKIFVWDRLTLNGIFTDKFGIPYKPEPSFLHSETRSNCNFNLHKVITFQIELIIQQMYSPNNFM
ncbi:hypothetical protein RchiOBHm_Chr7g0234651 [Rosa chinensis]|uniref:Uncharacterized protein n=1 Tax=Rosa chinensis TaxID=74649 RepID=A0A2P6PGH7_ROSCH|nr:hypothetical protein RchiOBHm_Chr7g0234651 [Rosa chinensis]